MRTTLEAIRRRRAALRGERGQALPLFVLMIFVIVGAVAIVTDVSWFWVSQQRMQRAADSAALAGAVYLPGDLTSAYATAREAATRNGYTSGANSVTVTPVQDPGNRRKLIVTIAGPVDTFFSRIFNNPTYRSTDVTQQNVSVTARAEYTLPVPMGSPQNYYGVGNFLGSTTTPGTSGPGATTSQRQPASSMPSGGTWTSPANVYGSGVTNSPTANNSAQQWSGFNFQTYVPNDATLVVEGIRIRMQGVDLQGSGSNPVCQLRTELSWNGGTNWSSQQNTSNLSTSPIDVDVGSATTMTAWGGHAWTYADFSNTNFRIRLTWLNGPLSTSPCPSTRFVDIDDIDVQVYWHVTVTTPPVTTCCTTKDVISPDGGVLAPQNFWAAMQSQGAPSIQGDAFMTKYDIRSGPVLNTTANHACPTYECEGVYNYDEYYNYGVKMPAGSSGGEVWIFDPGHCEVASANGTGDNWSVGGANGYSSAQPVSAYYELWNTVGTPYDIQDDTRIDSTADDTDFRQLYNSDTIYGGNTSGTSCSATTWHNGWWRLASGLTGGNTYRVHTFSTDKTSLTDQNNTTALNSFAIYAKATGGTPRVFGIGAMEAYVRLPGGQSSEFYLAQIDAASAGKTVEIMLWDPGDTGSLSASLAILAPGATNYTATTFDWASKRGTSSTAASNCNGLSGTNVTSVVTNTGGTSVFNGCWLTITIPLPSTYSAPHPSSDTITTDSGWWKIRYSMGGATTSNSTDLTTWKVTILGKPVHLVP